MYILYSYIGNLSMKLRHGFQLKLPIWEMEVTWFPL